MYLSELEQASLIPYYDENFSYYLSQSNTEQKLSYLEKQRIRQSLGNMIDFIRVTRSDLQNVLIVYENNCLFYSTSLFDTAPVSGYSYKEETWYQDAIAANGGTLLLPLHTPSYFGTDAQPVFSLVRSLVNLRTRIPYAVIKVDVPADVFDTFLKDVSFYVNSSLFLMDEEQNLIYTNNDSSLQLNLSDVLSADPEQAEITAGDKKLIHESMEIASYKWKLHIYIDQSAIIQKQHGIYLTAFLLYTFGVIFALLSYLGISRSMIQSIHSIAECLNAFKTGDFQKRYVSSSHDELAFLGESVNNMGQQLDELIQREYISTLQRKEAEMRALQSQIRPHFLFNTIGSLIALNQLRKTKELEESLFSLSSLLRYVIDSQIMVSLQEELTFSENYFRLQKLRFGTKLTYSIQCQEDIKEFPLPRLLLQPYFENAVIHGIEPCEHDCTVKIEAAETEHGILIQIRDNGVGFQSGKSEGIGMSNSKERLENSYPKSKITIDSQDGHGCCVTLDIIKGELS